MPDVRPFRGLRYNQTLAGDLDTLIAPPYDAISDDLQRRLLEASPFNIVRLEYGQETGAERYAAAGMLIREWRLKQILSREPEPAMYLYQQEFTQDGRLYRRRSIVARVRLARFESGIVRPHEFTMSGPKEDRLQLMRATVANVSPVLCLYRAGNGDPVAAIDLEAGGSRAVHGTDLAGERHTVLPITEVGAQREIGNFLLPRTLYIADGHHRYETALRYLDERRTEARSWSPEHPANFVMMALTPDNDSGLLILPIHRLVHLAVVPADLEQRLARYFDVRSLPGSVHEPQAVQAATEQLAMANQAAFVAAGLLPGRLALLTLRDRAAVEMLMPAERSSAWKELDVNVLQYGILDAGLGIDIGKITTGDLLEFSEDAEGTVAAVRDGRAPLAFLVRPTRPEHIFAVADTGDRMPQKSTYFYPKLGTGLVINPLE